jgi:5-methylcytosine-specific restriction endonuclease McrA
MTQPDRLLAAVLERDGGRCSLCGLDTERLRLACLRWLAVYGVDRKASPLGYSSRWGGPTRHPLRRGARAELAHRLTLRGLPTGDRALTHLVADRRCWWDGDHTTPIADGGHPCDIQNMRTLCYWCHKRETAEAATRRAEARRLEHVPEPTEPVPQLALFGQP